MSSPTDGRSNHGRVVIVTGAGSGIGRATVEMLVAEGSHVIAVDLDLHCLAWQREGHEDAVAADFGDAVAMLAEGGDAGAGHGRCLAA